MKIVQFSNGKYGVRTYWFFGWRFVDRKQVIFSWPIGDDDFKDCMCDSFNEALQLAVKRNETHKKLTYKIKESV